MAKKVSFNDIPSKNTDWGLDNTNGLPFSGQSVQKYLKKALDSKVGILYYDITNNRYLVFSDEENRDIYLDDPTRTDLLIGTFDAPFNYTAEISLSSTSYNTVFLGSTGNYINFTFDVKNKQGVSTGENVTVTYTFIRNANKKVITETRRYGESVHFNVDDYIETGTNTIIVGIIGQTTLAATTMAITYQVIDLKLVDEFDVSNVYNLANEAKTMEVFFTVSGYGTKTVEWFLDGIQLPFVKSEDEVVDVSSSRTKYITLSNLASGVHSLQIRAYTLINGEKFYTDTLYRDIMINNGDVDENLIAISTSLPHSHGIVNDSNPLAFYGAEQYLPYEIKFATRKGADVTISLGGTILTTLATQSGRETTYSVVSNKSGTLALKFTFSGVEREIPFAIANTSLDIEEITSALSFDFSAKGRSNSSVDKDTWKYGTYTGTFSGFNWNASSGWVDNALLINNGASFSVDIAPLAKDATSTGKTLEFEFSTRNVENDETVICDLTGDNGAGLVITASEARLVSAAGEIVSTKFKAGEVNRITFVVNRKIGTTYKGLAFIYVNGIISGAINFGTADNYISPKTLSFRGSDGAQVELRSMRFYDTALSSENILNNYILYRDTLVEMLEVYYRNDIYEEGTVTFSPDKAQHRLPVMIVTGDIPTLEAATSTSTQVIVDVDYVNEQDPSKNFKMKGAAMRIQGTSSLAYPRKNFRIYTEKSEGTIVYDANGEVIQNKLYAFKDDAQPVNCWCLKADFAESSGTHNTGIARLWNDAMYNAIIQHTNILNEEVNGYALRTKAQNEALKAGYTYDVRTTIDGFPILLFYKRNASDTNLIFLGKYNFNNDKSTPSVFGFEGIPGFNNSRMQCWETKDNGHPLGLFTDISGFDEDWEEAFESRYPETTTPNTADLKAFSLWINGVSQENFATEKWAHLDVYKVAAYYVYLMRFGAVDQTVKNGFITSEDGVHFFYINYDNDTINGLINTGELRLDPEINRQTIGSDGEYVYAGHDSVLWNKCEADTEFMEIVKLVDNAMYSAGLRYDNVISMFNDKQASKWVERVYNQDAEYKYILPFVNAGTNNLFMLQGSRSSHRSWWLSKRFSLYDSLFVSGNYRDRNISFKCLNDTKPGQKFTITAGTPMDYGYGVNNGIREVGISLAKGDSHTFTTTDTLNLGDVVKIFTAQNLFGLDLSAMASRIAVLDVSASFDSSLGSKLKRLILGSTDGQINTELSSISGLDVLKNLQELDVTNYKGITSLDLSSHKDFRKLYAVGSNLASVLFSKGAPVEHLELPATILALDLQQLPYLNTNELVLENNSRINSIRIEGCPNLSNDITFIENWLSNKTTEDSLCTLIMDTVAWEDVDYQMLIKISKLGHLSLKGYAKLVEVSEEIVDSLTSAFGVDIFNPDSEFFIDAPKSLFLSGPSEILEGENAQYNVVVFPATGGGTVRWSLEGSRTGLTMDNGFVSTVENGYSDSSLKIVAIYIPDEGSNVTVKKDFIVRRRTYPSSSYTKIIGPSTISDKGIYYLQIDGTYTGKYYIDWSLSGDMASTFIVRQRLDGGCEVVGTAPASLLTGTLKAAVRKHYNNDIATTLNMDISAINENIAEIDPVVCQLMYDAGLCENNTYVTKAEARQVVKEDIATIFRNSDIKSFIGFQYFTSVTEIPDSCFRNCSSLKAIGIPPSIVKSGYDAFGNSFSHWGVEEVYISDLKSWCNISFNGSTYSNPLAANRNGGKLFINNSLVENLILPEGVEFKYKSFQYIDVKTITIPDSVEAINCELVNTDMDSTPSDSLPRSYNIKGGKNITSIRYNAINIINILGHICINSIEKGCNFAAIRIPSGVNIKNNSTENGTALVILGDQEFTPPNGAYFEDMTTSKTIKIGWTGGVEDLSDRLKIGYITLNISSNKPDAEFRVDYTDSSGELASTIVQGAGNHILPMKVSTTATITPITEYEGEMGQSATVSYVSALNSVTCNYIERVYVLIKHINGTLYTTDDWSAGLSAGTLSNDQADGVCVMRDISGGFVIAKEDVSRFGVAWGGYGKSVLNDFSNNTEAKLDFDGYGNTQKIIEQLAGYTDGQGIVGAPAAEACADYTFPSGAKGYLPAFGELYSIYMFEKEIQSAMSLIGGKHVKKGSADIYWSSTQNSSQKIWGWRFSFNDAGAYPKVDTCLVRAFAPFGYLFINSTLSTLFDVSYTNNQGKNVTRTVGVGTTAFNVKMGTTMTITPRPIGTLTTEAQTITWDDTVKEVAFAFAKDAGVYIQHTNGSLHTEAEWTAMGYTNDVANGVAILSATTPAFVIAKSNASDWSSWGGYRKLITDIVTSESQAIAVLDFDGYGNTQKIIEQLAGYTDGQGIVGAPAAEACADYTFPNGKTGYMGASSQWQAVYNNKAAVDSAMSLIGGTALSTKAYWSSTQKSGNDAWLINWSMGTTSTYKYLEVKTRAFTDL